MNIVNFTPITAFTGGLIIGLAVVIFFLLNGRLVGISGILLYRQLLEALLQRCWSSKVTSSNEWRSSDLQDALKHCGGGTSVIIEE